MISVLITAVLFVQGIEHRPKLARSIQDCRISARGAGLKKNASANKPGPNRDDGNAQQGHARGPSTFSNSNSRTWVARSVRLALSQAVVRLGHVPVRVAHAFIDKNICKLNLSDKRVRISVSCAVRKEHCGVGRGMRLAAGRSKDASNSPRRYGSVHTSALVRPRQVGNLKRLSVETETTRNIGCYSIGPPAKHF